MSAAARTTCRSSPTRFVAKIEKLLADKEADLMEI